MTLKIPGVKPARPGDLIMITVPNYWAKGETKEIALEELRKYGGRINGPWRIHSVHPDTYVNEMGGINHKTDHGPIMLCEHNPEG